MTIEEFLAHFEIKVAGAEGWSDPVDLSDLLEFEFRRKKDESL